MLNLKGQKFGRLTVLDDEPRSIKGYRWWHCRCDCGTEKWVNGSRLKSGQTKSCGCISKEKLTKVASQYEDLTGKKFGRLTVIRSAEKQEKNASHQWLCHCDCGKTITVAANQLKRGDVRSCGCLKKEVAQEKFDKFAETNYVENTMLNGLTKKVSRRSTTGVKGVYWNKSRQLYEAYITFQKKRHFLGRFVDLEEAAQARRQAEKTYFDPMLEKHGKEKTK